MDAGELSSVRPHCVLTPEQNGRLRGFGAPEEVSPPRGAPFPSQPPAGQPPPADATRPRISPPTRPPHRRDIFLSEM